MRRIIIGLFVIFFINPEGNAQLPFSISDLWTVMKWCDTLVDKTVTYKSAADAIKGDDNNKELSKILNEVGKISSQLDSFTSKIDQKLDGILNTLLNNLRDNIILQFGKTQLNDLFNTIDRLHNKAITLRFRAQFGGSILKNFVESILWDSKSVPETLEQINQLILPSTHYVVPPIIQLMLKDAQVYKIIYKYNHVYYLHWKKKYNKMFSNLQTFSTLNKLFSLCISENFQIQ